MTRLGYYSAESSMVAEERPMQDLVQTPIQIDELKEQINEDVMHATNMMALRRISKVILILSLLLVIASIVGFMDM